MQTRVPATFTSAQSYACIALITPRQIAGIALDKGLVLVQGFTVQNTLVYLQIITRHDVGMEALHSVLVAGAAVEIGSFNSVCQLQRMR